jgi:hypothetical protein
VGIRGKIVGEKEIANLKVLRDWFPVIPGYPRRKILRRFNSPRCGFNGKPRNGDWCSRAARIRIQHLIVNNDALSGVRVAEKMVRRPQR